MRSENEIEKGLIVKLHGKPSEDQKTQATLSMQALLCQFGGNAMHALAKGCIYIVQADDLLIEQAHELEGLKEENAALRKRLIPDCV